MSRFLPPAWFLSAGVVILLVAGFGYADKTRLHWYAEGSEPSAARGAVAALEPDRVVGVIRRCIFYDTANAAQVQATEDDCLRPGARPPGHRQEVSVRTQQGIIYLVSVPVSSAVKVGDDVAALTGWRVANPTARIRPAFLA